MSHDDLKGGGKDGDHGNVRCHREAHLIESRKWESGRVLFLRGRG